MIKLENTETHGWEAALRGARNPMNSWDRADSYFSITGLPIIGENDLGLMKRLSAAGNDHAKYLRMINVMVDITAPLYWWKEFDTYKVGTVANSCSTMHKIHVRPFTRIDFSHEQLEPWALEIFDSVIWGLNVAREYFVEDGNKADWWQMIQLLPSSYNQRRTVQMNYAVIKNMYFSRRNHKLNEWLEFCEWAENLPYFKEVVIQDEG